MAVCGDQGVSRRVRHPRCAGSGRSAGRGGGLCLRRLRHQRGAPRDRDWGRTGEISLNAGTGAIKTDMKSVKTKKELSPAEREELLKTVKVRFEENMDRHEGLEWANVQARL